MDLKDKIEELLHNNFNICNLRIIDNSYKHRNHKGVKESGVNGHFEIEIISSDFDGISSIQRHRMINMALQDEIGKTIHSLSINAKSTKDVK